MSPKPRQGLFHFLTEPAASIREPTDRFAARLLSELLIVLLPLGILITLLPPIVDPAGHPLIDRDVILILGGLALWGLTYAFSRTKHFKPAATLSTTVASVGIIFLALVDNDLTKAYYLVIPVLLFSILLGLRATSLLATACALSLYLIPLLNPEVTLLEVLTKPASFISIAFSLILISVSYRNRLEEHRQSELSGLYDQAQHEIVERKRAEQRLQHDAFHDRLTGLPNRALFKDRLQRALARARRDEGHMFGVLFLDIDHFKNVNDSQGHSAGDELLLGFASRLSDAVREIDTVARLGGDEFVILLEDVEDTDHARVVAERLQRKLHTKFLINGHEVHITASIGLVLSGGGYSRPEEMLRDADLAMYQAKSAGRGQLATFDQLMREQLISRLDLESRLRQAIERQEFVLHYQPIVSIETGNVSGFEALLRWQPPGADLVFPGQLLLVAEETGLILPIGMWALRTACSQILVWQQKFAQSPPLTISVNLSAKQLAQPDLADHVAEVLQETQLQPNSLHLEVTESAVIQELGRATALLDQLRGLGVGIQLDDFGTGYSSLSHVHRLPIETIKIDRSFIAVMPLGNDKPDLTKAIVSLGHELGLSIIAEGVETKEQLRRLRELGADFGQGYYFHKPGSAEAIEAYLTKHDQPAAG